MKRYLVLWILALPLLALAQETTEDEGAAVDVPPTDPCVVETPGEEGDGEQPLADGEGTGGPDGGADAISPPAGDCERIAPTEGALAVDEVGTEDGQAVEGQGDASESAGANDESESDPDDEEFIPSEEISEDYPVPLPSDI